MFSGDSLCTPETITAVLDAFVERGAGGREAYHLSYLVAELAECDALGTFVSVLANTLEEEDDVLRTVNGTQYVLCANPLFEAVQVRIRNTTSWMSFKEESLVDAVTKAFQVMRVGTTCQSCGSLVKHTQTHCEVCVRIWNDEGCSQCGGKMGLLVNKKHMKC